jgi:hypothetical protein
MARVRRIVGNGSELNRPQKRNAIDTRFWPSFRGEAGAGRGAPLASGGRDPSRFKTILPGVTHSAKPQDLSGVSVLDCHEVVDCHPLTHQPETTFAILSPPLEPSTEGDPGR